MERSVSGNNFDFDRIFINIKRGVYRCIGMGSGRVVFDLGNGYVVKAARNQRGIAQNEAEYKIALADNSSLFAKIPGVSEGFVLLVMAKAERIKDISFVWKYFNVKNNQELIEVKKIRDISQRNGLLFYDLVRPVNWGQIDGKPVVIDYGFTREVYRRYYAPLFRR